MVAATANNPTTRRKPPPPVSLSTVRLAILLATAFVLGLAVCSAFFLYATHSTDPVLSTSHLPHYHGSSPILPPPQRANDTPATNGRGGDDVRVEVSASSPSGVGTASILDGLRVLVTIASFDFLQLAHLEEMLDGFQDLCYAGSKVDIVVYTTVLVSGVSCAYLDFYEDWPLMNSCSLKLVSYIWG